MSDFDLQHILESKRAFRQKLAARSVAEKLRLLDELRARALVIRGASARAVNRVGEDHGRYGANKPK
ncbi:MAG: hypothetical protein ACREIA_02865 [Opitutaceae bacterium]